MTILKTKATRTRGTKGDEKMNKKKVLKVFENLKEIQYECMKVDDCSKCEFYSNGGYGRCLLDWDLKDGLVLPCYWIIDEKIDEIKESIELSEVLAKKGD